MPNFIGESTLPSEGGGEGFWRGLEGEKSEVFITFQPGKNTFMVMLKLENRVGHVWTVSG